MPRSKSLLAIALLAAAAVSLPADARNNSGGRGSHARSGAHAHGGAHARAHARGVAPHRHFVSRPRFGAFLGAPVFAAPYWLSPYFPPAIYLPPPVEYIERPAEGALHFCPEAGGYYPLVLQCPGSWEQTTLHSMSTWPPAGEWAPAPAAY